jgi:hypothetical protein
MARLMGVADAEVLVARAPDSTTASWEDLNRGIDRPHLVDEVPAGWDAELVGERPQAVRTAVQAVLVQPRQIEADLRRPALFVGWRRTNGRARGRGPDQEDGYEVQTSAHRRGSQLHTLDDDLDIGGMSPRDDEIGGR